MVAYEHQLCSGCFSMGGEAHQIDVVGHSDFIQDDSGSFVKAELVAIETPDQAGQGPRLVDASLIAERASGLARSRATDHVAAGLFECGRHHPQQRRLPRTRHANDKFGGSARAADVDCDSPLFVRQPRANGGLGGNDGCLDCLGSDGGGVGPCEQTGHALRDGLLAGQYHGELRRTGSDGRWLRRGRKAACKHFGYAGSNSQLKRRGRRRARRGAWEHCRRRGPLPQLANPE